MTCSTCANWNLRGNPQMAALHLAACALGPRWTFLPTHATCARWKAMEPAQEAKRAAWLLPSSSAPAVQG